MPINPRFSLALLALMFVALVAGVIAENVPRDPYAASILEFRQNKETALRADDGWLTVAGLFWLKEGNNDFGSDPTNAIQLPAPAPAHLGKLVLHGANIILEPAYDHELLLNGKKAERAELKVKPRPDLMTYQNLTFFVIHRGDRFALRLRNKDNPARKHFAGMKFFPIDRQYRIQANWLPSDPPKKISVPTILGTSVDMVSPGTIEFSLQGTKYRLTPVLEEPDSKELFIIFGDWTNAKGSYGGGRFLYTPLPMNGKVVLDFNRAENPPCAFTPYATCPLPPKENKLSVAIPAGEQFTGHAAH
ncbi:MAG TPA: DUF1684 domain-containing protein [Terriglobales bacterium]|nr:DUF1684 domain-containing protein [Terriglobales bacterium]